MQGDSPRSPQPPQALRDSAVACNFNNAIVFMWTVVLLSCFFGMLLLSSLLCMASADSEFGLRGATPQTRVQIDSVTSFLTIIAASNI
jgi:hypothetical protein